MGWIQQTKIGSRRSGGPQYYLQGIGESLKHLLKARGACEVWLGTPYGVVQSGLMAVAADRVLEDGQLRSGKVGHDRIQRQTASQSVGEQIKHWYNISAPGEPYHIEFLEHVYQQAFLFIPARIQFSLNGRPRNLPVDPQPLTFTMNHRSALIQTQVNSLRKTPDVLKWVSHQIGRVIHDHLAAPCPYIKEEDLLRASGALSHLGIDLSAYCGKGYDCLTSTFTLGGYPTYSCAVEIKKVSSGFNYQILKHTNPARAAVLCMEHNPSFTPPAVVDVIELQALHKSLAESA